MRRVGRVPCLETSVIVIIAGALLEEAEFRVLQPFLLSALLADALDEAQHAQHSRVANSILGDDRFNSISVILQTKLIIGLDELSQWPTFCVGLGIPHC